MEDKKIVPNENEVELNDEQLDSVSGGLLSKAFLSHAPSAAKSSPATENAKRMRKLAKAELRLPCF